MPPRRSLISLVANTPVRIAPTVPPMPCTPNASSASSYPNIAFTLATMKKHTMPVTAPMISADIGVTKPAAGVMPTRPATAPEIAPSMLGLPITIHSTISQAHAAAAAPKCVETNALDAEARCVQRATGVEAEPAHPEKSRTDGAEHHAMRTHRFRAEAFAFAEVESASPVPKRPR